MSFGYRTTAISYVSLDFSTYFNSYDNQRTVEPGAPFPESNPLPAHLVLPVIYKKLPVWRDARVRGFRQLESEPPVERESWICPGANSHAHLSRESKRNSQCFRGGEQYPRHSAQLRSHVNLWPAVDWDTSTFFVSPLTAQKVPSYTRLDSQISWKISERIALSIVGQNLLKNTHIEFQDDSEGSRTTEMKRSGFARLTWRF